MRQSFDLFRQAVGIVGLHDLDDPRMQRSSPLLRQIAVGRLVGQGVLEGVDMLREEAGLIHELGHLELLEAVVHGCFG